MKQSKKPLAGRVAVVAGSTRGAGRGIARGLAEAGAIVYCTGRSVPGRLSPYGRPETIDETAAMITAAGGTAVPVRVDHAVEAEVEALFARIDREHGRLDVLADSVGGENPLLGGYGWFWTTDLTNGAAAFQQSLLSHIITAKHAAKLMTRDKRGLLVEVTESDVLGSGGNPVAQVVKLALKGIAMNMAAELRPYGVTSVALTPGFLRSERMLEHFGVTEANWRDGVKKDSNFVVSETPLYVGRAVAALAADPNVIEKTGQLFSSWDLAREYRFTDVDGRRPDWGRHTIDWSEFPEEFLEYFRAGGDIQTKWLATLSKRTKAFAAKVPRRKKKKTRKKKR
jgi:NAD(P)-dependent dehydrogenase (short-subunit alcohol dehydrogenase family)